MVNEAAAKRLTAILCGMDRVEKQVFALRGMAMLLVEERELFRWVLDDEVGDYYVSFDKWLKDTCPNSWGYCRDALRAVKELKDMPFEDLLQIKRCNLEQLKKVSLSVRLLPDVVQAAKSLPEKEFVDKLNKQHDQHLDVKQPVVMADSGDLSEFEHAIEIAMALEDCHSRAEAIRVIAIDYTQEHETEYLAMTAQEETA
jgi:hypothetical protein